jgi:hypothetical protein
MAAAGKPPQISASNRSATVGIGVPVSTTFVIVVPSKSQVCRVYPRPTKGDAVILGLARAAKTLPVAAVFPAVSFHSIAETSFSSSRWWSPPEAVGRVHAAPLERFRAEMSSQKRLPICLSK